MDRVGGRWEKMEGHCSTGQSPQWAVVPMEEEEEEEEEEDIYIHISNGKAISIYVWTGPEGSGRLKLPDFKTGGKVVSPTHRPPLPSRKCSWYSFLLETESTLGP